MSSEDHLYAVKIREIWDYIWTQDILFWLVNIYLFFEYVRPQTLYPVLDFFPYSKTLIIVSFFAVIFKGGPFTRSSGNFFLFLFLGVVLLSSSFALKPSISYSNLYIMISWVLVYFIIVNTINTEKRFFVFLLAFLLYSFKMSQHSFLGWARIGFGFSDWGTGGGPGWFENSGEFGIQMCVILGISFYFFISLRNHWSNEKWGKIKTFFFFLFPFTALTGTISSSSRGAMVGAAAVILVFMYKSKRKFAAVALTAIVAIAAYSMIPEASIERFEAAGTDTTSEKRLDRWERGIDMGNAYPILGIGYKNWEFANRVLYGRVEGELVHNIFIECFSELGYLGLAAFLLLIAASFYINRQTRKYLAPFEDRFLYNMANGLDAALVGYLVSGFFVTVLYYPYFWINLAFTVSLNNVARNKLLAENASE